MKEEQDDLTLVYMFGYKNGKDSLKDEIERLLLIEQGAANLCDKCGWRMKFPNEECRNCENAKLRDEIERLRAANDYLCSRVDYLPYCHEIERLREALEDIANERGVCLTCGELAQRGYKGAVFCDPHLFGLDQGCKWSPQNPTDLARTALEGEKTDEAD